MQLNILPAWAAEPIISEMWTHSLQDEHEKLGQCTQWKSCHPGGPLKCNRNIDVSRWEILSLALEKYSWPYLRNTAWWELLQIIWWHPSARLAYSNCLMRSNRGHSLPAEHTGLLSECKSQSTWMPIIHFYPGNQPTSSQHGQKFANWFVHILSLSPSLSPWLCFLFLSESFSG